MIADRLLCLSVISVIPRWHRSDFRLEIFMECSWLFFRNSVPHKEPIYDPYQIWVREVQPMDRSFQVMSWSCQLMYWPVPWPLLLVSCIVLTEFRPQWRDYFLCYKLMKTAKYMLNLPFDGRKTPINGGNRSKSTVLVQYVSPFRWLAVFYRFANQNTRHYNRVL